MRRVEAHLQWSPDEIVQVGQLASDGRTTVFEYADSFIQAGLPLSPFRLPLEPGLYEHRDDRTFGPLPGLFDDSLPDGWGMLLMDRQLARRGIDVRAVSPLDRLTYLGTRTMGALTYHPAETTGEHSPRYVDLAELGKESHDILAGQADEVLPVLAAAGGSAGGARPKVVVGIRGDEVITGDQDLPNGFEPWLVKFSAESDGKDAGRIEHAYLAMAAAAGIEVPPNRLFVIDDDRAYVGLRRFDRTGRNERVHMHTLSGLLHATHRAPSVDYNALLTVAGRLTQDYRTVVEAFRRMVFNVAAHNRDDHTKNFTFLMDRTGQWRMSPVYDLTYAAGPGGEHTLAVAGEGRDPGRTDILAVAREARIKEADTLAVIDDVNAAIDRWDEIAANSGVSRRRCKEVAAALRRL